MVPRSLVASPGYLVQREAPEKPEDVRFDGPFVVI